MGIDLDEEGIAIVPIFGTHFAAYAKLFGPGGIQKKCAILTDGDLLPSDADPNVAGDEGRSISQRSQPSGVKCSCAANTWKFSPARLPLSGS